MTDTLTYEVASPLPLTHPTTTATIVPHDHDLHKDVSDDSGDGGNIRSTTATTGKGRKVASLQRTEILYPQPPKKHVLDGAVGLTGQPSLEKLFEEESKGKELQDEDDEEDKVEAYPRRITLRPTLEDELDGCRLLALPGLVEHLFPNSLFPMPFETLKLMAMLQHWDKSRNRWKDPDITSATFFNDLTETLVHTAVTRSFFRLPSTRIWRSECHMPPLGASENYKRQPGLNLVDERDGPATWSTSLVTVERKSKASESADALVQLTNGASMIFSRQEERRFHIGISICGTEVRLYVFDRAGIVGSTPFHLRKDPELLIRLMCGLILTEDFAVGLDSSIKSTESWDFRTCYKDVTVSGRTYRLLETLSVSRDLTGRGTVVRRASHNGVHYIIKDTWVAFSLKKHWTEPDFLRDVTEAGLEGVPTLIGQEIVTLPDGRPDDTTHLRSFIKDVEDYQGKEVYEQLDNMYHLRIVVSPVAKPLKFFKSRKELLTVLIDAIEAHRRLVERRIIHSDISSGNIMIHRPEDNPKELAVEKANNHESSTPDGLPQLGDPPRARGLLIDFDCSFVSHDDDGNHTEQAIENARFTGTVLFASTEVLMGLAPGQIREAHHDLESFFYVFLWIALCYEGPNGRKRRDIDMEKTAPFRYWTEGGNSGNMPELGEAKYSTMTTTRAHFRKIVTGRCTRYFKSLIPCIEELWLKFFPKEPVVSGDDTNFPPEDPRPKVTHQEMIDILRKPLEWLPDDDVRPPHRPLKRKSLVGDCDDESLDEDRSPPHKRVRAEVLSL